MLFLYKSVAGKHPVDHLRCTCNENSLFGNALDVFHFYASSAGNKKGPVGRWDFETTEEYSDYMNTKEAMPKAAFQVGS